MSAPTAPGAQAPRRLGHRAEPSACGAPVLTAWSVASAFGMGASVFAAGLREGCNALAPPEPDEWPLAGSRRVGATVPGFTVSGTLGRKGTRSMDRVTGLAVATVGTLLAGERALVENAGDVGLVLGTSMGSVQSTIDFTRDSLTEEKPYYVDPARFPNTVMNCAAGQCAIWHGLRGPNATIAGGRASALLALTYAIRLQRCGHVETVLWGAVEELSVQRAWLQWQAFGPGPPLGEACGLFLLEPPDGARAAGRQPLGTVRALEFGVYGTEATVPERLVGCVRRALVRAGLELDDVWAIAPSCGDWPEGDGERKALAGLFGGRRPQWVPSVDLVGDTGAASAAVQLAAVLATGAGESRARGRAALITSVDRDGLLGCALVELA